MTLLQRFFFGLAEQTFEVKLGVVDPPLVDYLSRLLVRSVRLDQFPNLRRPHGEAIGEISRLFEEADRHAAIERRRFHRHIGDYTMFWVGLFPESLRHPKSDAEMNPLGEYCLCGKHAYLTASSIPAEDEGAPSCDVLQRLGLEFEMCAYGLREVRREWEESEEELPGPLLG
jgi:hypothetical protein